MPPMPIMELFNFLHRFNQGRPVMTTQSTALDAREGRNFFHGALCALGPQVELLQDVARAGVGSSHDAGRGGGFIFYYGSKENGGKKTRTRAYCTGK
eukprot:CAMPEP_0171893700 /NCGR_PEP_ID=MMETSP0992-20121227/46032_1 /TAXON_ID=483369 /ORGANISM="non described non described, Strain CCMP2098" /LENGTH=96 /DNA_ID=CAMNT_0012521359 /DNA_START=167 /DNA_END=457 /DNA_ORIENTATION=-